MILLYFKKNDCLHLKFPFYFTPFIWQLKSLGCFIFYFKYVKSSIKCQGFSVSGFMKISLRQRLQAFFQISGILVILQLIWKWGESLPEWLFDATSSQWNVNVLQQTLDTGSKAASYQKRIKLFLDIFVLNLWVNISMATVDWQPSAAVARRRADNLCGDTDV